MDDKENKTPEETKPQEEPKAPAEDTDAGDKPKTTSLIDRADAASERLGKLLKQENANLDRREALMVSDRLGGRTEAGQSQDKQFTPEEKASRARIKAVADASGSKWGEKYE